ncbi:type VI secretion system baseplate subunit TssF [Aromatoleum evansii]|uniref:Type VI secretion system baseplate subunit TssF n=1 Tax=Aromatoleum evansii TaxID=59406 RepID=A0ABZ1APG1_AROEV|nr:type VI secretion system baseplate subunit TssF [Aromatoleum evansii]NMG29879.1 type VI secretion system baseplate subunit TssF [Aromatoleum evansii]WRL47760.1 type VI secretion system baseplate subunit TssF [Aromatoleum evansii]
MEDLLPYYERELAFLRGNSREFAERYPKIAARLLLNGEGCDDPHVERMIESFALLSARISRKLEDSYPLFTEALLQVLYPHYLRPFPACSIAHFDGGDGASQLSRPAALQRGTELRSRAVNGVSCRFRTAWRVELLPLRVDELRFEPVANIPAAVRAPLGVSGMLSLRFAVQGGGGALGGIERVRLYIDAEPSVAAALRDALFLRVLRTWVEDASGTWHRVEGPVIGEVGLAADEALVDFPDNAHDAYRHLTEYFAFPEKYNFFDLLLTRLPGVARGGGALRVHFALKDVRPDGEIARLLGGLGGDSLKLGCVPVVNLFQRPGDPIRLTGRTSTYPVVADGRQAHAYEVYSIDAVSRVSRRPDGEAQTEYRPFFSLRHGESPGRDGHYWHAQRDARVAERSPGYETALTIVDAGFEPLQPGTDILSVALTCTNRDLPARLAIGLEGGDLHVEGGGAVRTIRLLRVPTLSCRFSHERDGLWRLISHLSLNHLSLTGNGLAAFKEMLGLYDVRRTPVSRRQIDGIRGIEQREKTCWMAGRPFASFVRGIEVRLTVDEDSFVGAGLDVFARVIDRFLGLYVQLNSFVQLVLVSVRTGEELVRCEPRSGDSILV